VSNSDTQLRAPGLSNEQARQLLNHAFENALDINSCLIGLPHASENILAGLANFSPEQELQLISNLLELSDKAPFELGYHIGLNSGLSSLGVIGQSMLSSSTVGEALATGARYLEKAFHFVHFSLRPISDKVKMVFHLQAETSEKVQAFLLAREIGINVSTHKLAFPDTLDIVIEAGFSGPEQIGMTHVADAFGCQIKFNCNENYLLSYADSLEQKMPFSNEVAAQILEQHCLSSISSFSASYLSKIDHVDLQDYGELEAKIVVILAAKEDFRMSREDVASELNMSSRSLARHLQTQGTNWRTLMSKLKIREAKRLLTQTNYSIQKISEQTGFASSSAFSLAFTRNQGMSPSEFKQQCGPHKSERLIAS
jgi:AraC-like DNA-binding protein